MKSTGICQPLVTGKDLDIMFHMFDITNKGTVTVAQATEALKTILGPAAEFDAPLSDEPSRLLTKEQFIQSMEKRLLASAPRFTR